MHETLRKFGYPGTLLRDYEHWVVLLRPQQVTAGCMVLALKADVRTLGEVGVAAFAELATATQDIQNALAAAFGPNKINYLALRSEEHTSELQSLMRISYAVFCLKK